MRQLTPRFYVSPQIECGDMDAIRSAGITRILCNRPDAEVPLELQAEAIRAAAEAAGISFVAQPLTHQTMTPHTIAENRAKGAATDDCVLAYCASGTRSTIAWALGNAGHKDPDQIIEVARAAGYDISQLRGVLGTPYCPD